MSRRSPRARAPPARTAPARPDPRRGVASDRSSRIGERRTRAGPSVEGSGPIRCAPEQHGLGPSHRGARHVPIEISPVARAGAPFSGAGQMVTRGACLATDRSLRAGPRCPSCPGTAAGSWACPARPGICRPCSAAAVAAIGAIGGGASTAPTAGTGGRADGRGQRSGSWRGHDAPERHRPARRTHTPPRSLNCFDPALRSRDARRPPRSPRSSPRSAACRSSPSPRPCR